MNYLSFDVGIKNLAYCLICFFRICLVLISGISPTVDVKFFPGPQPYSKTIIIIYLNLLLITILKAESCH